MDPIDLSDNWQMTTANTDRFDVLLASDPSWQAVSESQRRIEFDRTDNFVWLRTTFAMPPNDQCVTWWLELDMLLHGALWVNGQCLGRLDDDNRPAIDITGAISIGQNTAAVCLVDETDGWPSVMCVPYLCA